MMIEHESDETDGDEKLIPGLLLSPREEAFCRFFGDPESLHYGRPTKAAVAAGYPEKSAWNTAWKLRRRPKIQARLAEFQAAATAAAGKVLSDLEHERLLALEKGDVASAIRASELAGKHLGLFFERNVLTVAVPREYDARAALDARRITAFLLMNPPDPALLAPPVPVAAETAGLAALEQNPQSPRPRQGE